MSEWNAAAGGVTQPAALRRVMFNGFAEGCAANDGVAGCTTLK